MHNHARRILALFPRFLPLYIYHFLGVEEEIRVRDFQNIEVPVKFFVSYGAYHVFERRRKKPEFASRFLDEQLLRCEY